ncbi:hypothetical protein F2Q69_00012096 [Brassica cretica]|uniref:beta-ketoacyl-[acyl-carrier-protein] synthase I n=1 Tax=Brassica cretica TaxID=69181 RepID=A0A8S9QZ00_BRACR|nr:hypothetical protein F2Q69_00012096 [Brassica cretica]
MTPALSVVSGEKKEEPDTKAVGSSAAGDDVSSPVDDVQKKIRHAERFGVSVKLTEEEKRNSRAEMLKAIGDVGPVVDAGGWVAPKLSKRMDKFMLYLLTTGKKALADGGVTSDEVMAEFNKAKCGVLIGSAMGGMKVFNDAIVSAEDLLQEDESFLCTFRHNEHGSLLKVEGAEADDKCSSVRTDYSKEAVIAVYEALVAADTGRAIIFLLSVHLITLRSIRF